MAQDLDKRYPLDTQMQSLWLPAIRAQLALDRNDPREAITDLQGVQPPAEFGIINFTLNPSCLYPTYIKGQAHLAFGQGTEAAAEFLKIRDHSGMVWNCSTGALAHIGIARANALQAKKKKAQRPMPLASVRWLVTGGSSSSGKAPIPTSPFSKQRKPRMRSCFNWTFYPNKKCLAIARRMSTGARPYPSWRLCARRNLFNQGNEARKDDTTLIQ